VKEVKSHIVFKKPLAKALKQLIKDKEDIQQKIHAGKEQELKKKYKVAQPL
jgi:hypothetical protein